jgi:hypothetical protein
LSGDRLFVATGSSLFKVASRAFSPAPFVLPESFAAYVGPGFVVTTPEAPGPGPTTTVPPTTARRHRARDPLTWPGG